MEISDSPKALNEVNNAVPLLIMGKIQNNI
jgi:hypothetical protein